MTNRIQVKCSSVEKEIAVHVLPCHIAHNGSSKVSQFFQTRTDPLDSTLVTSSFRGRKLCGQNVSLPKNYSGISSPLLSAYLGHVYAPVDASTRFDSSKYERDDDEDEDVEKTVWQSDEKFDALTVWEHHTLPDINQDHWIRGIQEWVAMADAVS